MGISQPLLGATGRRGWDLHQSQGDQTLLFKMKQDCIQCKPDHVFSGLRVSCLSVQPREPSSTSLSEPPFPQWWFNKYQAIVPFNDVMNVKCFASCKSLYPLVVTISAWQNQQLQVKESRWSMQMWSFPRNLWSVNALEGQHVLSLPGFWDF